MGLLQTSCYAVEFCFGVLAIYWPDYVWRIFTKRAGTVRDRKRFLIRSLGVIILVGLAIQAAFWAFGSYDISNR